MEKANKAAREKNVADKVVAMVGSGANAAVWEAVRVNVVATEMANQKGGKSRRRRTNRKHKSRRH